LLKNVYSIIKGHKLYYVKYGDSLFDYRFIDAGGGCFTMPMYYYLCAKCNIRILDITHDDCFISCNEQIIKSIIE
jgi:hypothetical protein